jgi:imidazolonepropionase
VEANGPQAIDLLVHSAARLVTPLGASALRGERLGELRVEPGAGVAIDAERIVAVGPDAELAARFLPRARVDARGGLVLPGFVDAHTHPVFVGTRVAEFELRTRGASYAEIAAAGGGILASVRDVRASTKEQLLARLCVRLDRFLELGTTTIEAKSGYGLSLEDELKMLAVIAAANRVHPVELVPTFLGAHSVPAEHRARRGDYLRLVVDEMLPRVAAEGLAEYCDVFTETGVFDVDESRAILTAARGLGLGLRLHVDQLTPLGGAQLAAELGAASADHLEFVSDAGIEALAAAGVAPVLCPLVPLYLRVAQEAPARRMIAAGLAVVLATDFNPGSCPLQSMPEVLTWAALRYRMTAAEVLTAATLNAAASLGRAADRGTLEPGKRADVVIADVEDEQQLVAEFGRNPVHCVIKSGRVAWQRA